MLLRPRFLHTRWWKLYGSWVGNTFSWMAGTRKIRKTVAIVEEKKKQPSLTLERRTMTSKTIGLVTLSDIETKRYYKIELTSDMLNNKLPAPAASLALHAIILLMYQHILKLDRHTLVTLTMEFVNQEDEAEVYLWHDELFGFMPQFSTIASKKFPFGVSLLKPAGSLRSCLLAYLEEKRNKWLFEWMAQQFGGWAPKTKPRLEKIQE